MKISKKRINSLKIHFSKIEPGTEFVVAFTVPAEGNSLLDRVGFVSPYAEGDAVLPAEIGPATRFNSNGRGIVRRDLPKESRYITTVEWTWEQFAGRGKTETQHESRPVYKDCYPKDIVPAPAAEVKIAQDGDGKVVVSEPLVWGQTADERIQAIVNVFLETFGQCEVRTTDLQRLTTPTLRKLNWRLLPPGRYPWSRVNEHLSESLKSRSKRYAGPVIERQEKMMAFSPSSVFVGQGGFRDYIAYVFDDKGLAVLESVKPNNATYIFSEDWQALSMLSKAEILDGALHQDRVIHTKNWGKRINELFG